MPVRSLGYIRLGAADPAAWRRFAGELLGLMETSDGDGALRYRMDDHPPRLVVGAAGEDRVEAVGFQVAGPEELVALSAAIEGAGAKVVALDPSECRDRGVAEAVRFDDPAGNPLELYWGPALEHRPVETPLVSGFVTGDQGMGHVVLSAPDTAEAYRFYTKVLGFRARNTMRLGDQTLWFLGCNRRHHTVGLMPMAGPGRLVHFMVEAATLDDVGRAWDRAEKLEVPVMQTLGRHTNDRMVSFYVISPGGFAVELGFDGLQVEVEEPVYEITAGALWGHRFVNFPQL